MSWENQGTTTAPKPKIVSIEIIDKTDTTIKVKVTTKRNVGGTLIYSIQEENGAYQERERVKQTATGELAQEEYTFNSLDRSKIYTKIKVEAIAENGETASKEIDVTTIPALTRNNVTFTYTVNGKSIREGEYTQGPITVKIATKNVDTTGYRLQYTTGNPEVAGDWKDYDNKTGVEFTIKGNLYVRLSDGRQGGRYATAIINNIDTLPPKQFTPEVTTGIDYIKVTGSTIDQEETTTSTSSGIAYYQFSKDNGETWVPKDGTTETSYTFDDLESGTNCKIKMKAIDKVGKETITEPIERATENIEIAYQYNPSTWTNGNVVVTIATTPSLPEGYTVEYSKDRTTWDSNNTMSEKGELYVRIKNANNYVIKDNMTANVANIDNTEPNKATLTIDATTIVTAKVEQNDNDAGSGVDITKCKWKYTKSNSEIGTDETNYTGGGTFTTNPQTITLDIQEKGIYYLHILTVDNVGNKKETISEAISVTLIEKTSTWTGQVNSPNLVGGMKAVYWEPNTTEKVLTYASSEEEWNNWYNYVEGDNQTDLKNSKWANAKMTKDGIDSYFVWIPRYEYKILSGKGTNTTGKIEVKFIPTSQTTPDEGYKIHPAFTNGTSNNFKNGEWDKELPGIWVGKYETSHSDATENSEGSGNTLAIVPNVQSWRNITVGECYTTAYNYDRDKESHLMKNSEWGACVYLTHSQYGRNGQEIDLNNSSNCITGNGGGSSNATANSGGITYAHNTTLGAQANSTGNMFGLYDLSGGAWEYVATYIENGNAVLSNGSSFTDQTRSTKYATIYPYDSSNDVLDTNYMTYKNANYGYGDAILETSSSGQGANSWFNGHSVFAFKDTPFLVRGGYYDSGTAAGLFSFSGIGGIAFERCFIPCCLSWNIVL